MEIIHVLQAFESHKWTAILVYMVGFSLVGLLAAIITRSVIVGYVVFVALCIILYLPLTELYWPWSQLLFVGIIIIGILRFFDIPKERDKGSGDD